jgi:hypothetical protein
MASSGIPTATAMFTARELVPRKADGIPSETHKQTRKCMGKRRRRSHGKGKCCTSVYICTRALSARMFYGQAVTTQHSDIIWLAPWEMHQAHKPTALRTHLPSPMPAACSTRSSTVHMRVRAGVSAKYTEMQPTITEATSPRITACCCQLSAMEILAARVTENGHNRS